jgi:poly(3-hydroxybutyrate) depolymerase
MIVPFLLFLSAIGLQKPAAIELREALVLDPVGQGGRVPIVTNALTAKLVKGDFTAPKEGEAFEWPGGQRSWSKLLAGEDGTFQSRAFRGGFAFVSVPSSSERTMMLEASGHSYVYVNGEPRGGDPYSFGFVRHPVRLHEGENTFLFQVGRGSLRARLVEPDGEVFFESRDSTLPDLIVGEGSGQAWCGVILTNATEKTFRSVTVTARVGDAGFQATQIGDLPPMMSQKVPVSFIAPAMSQAGQQPLQVRVEVKDGELTLTATQTYTLEAKRLHEIHKRTFVSEIDGSVQYYAVRPPLEEDIKTADGLVLTVHGAGVEATGQAAAYGPKSWCWIVAATNRRPYGFDWEDWGRIDALEVLADAKRRYKPSEERIYLTGHSMGGHGAWYLGATHPDQWAAVGPAAGWINFWSYGGAVRYEDPDPIEAVLLRASSVSDTTKLLRNYLHHGVFVLHGDADETVPVAQARQMRSLLEPFHKDVAWHEQPGGGHWYDTTPEPGADCVDYAPMFEFFRSHRRTPSQEVRRVEFTTVSPGVTATCHWVTVVQQDTQLAPSSVVAEVVGERKLRVTTSNVSAMTITVSRSPLRGTSGPFELEVDGVALTAERAVADRIVLLQQGGTWIWTPVFNGAGKTPDRPSSFRSAFNNRFGLVYGTKGTPEENAWSYAKARYDAETWYYRGNGRALIIPDTDFPKDPGPIALGGPIKFRNFVLYGNEASNSAVAGALKGSPLRLGSGSLDVGGRQIHGLGLSVLAVRPAMTVRKFEHAGTTTLTHQYAIVGGTDIVGMRSTDLMPYFVSGVHYPDFFVYDARIHTIGSRAVLAAGFFGNDWSVENGDIAFR